MSSNTATPEVVFHPHQSPLFERYVSKVKVSSHNSANKKRGPKGPQTLTLTNWLIGYAA